MTTIRGRILVVLLTGLTGVLAAGGAAVYWIAAADLTRQFDAGLNARAHTLAALLKLEPEGLVFEVSDAPAATIADTHFELRTHDGRLLKRSKNLGVMDLPLRTLGENEIATTDVGLPGEVEGRALWLAFRPRVDPDDWEDRDIDQAEPELVVVAAAMDRRPIDRALATLFTALIVVGGAVGLAGGILVAVGTRWGLIPLDRLRRQLGSVNSQTISKRLDDARAPRELTPVYRELNNMLDRVQRTIERERSFADAAAHELRTPLAELRATAEVALRWPDARPATATINEVLSIGDEMERLVESLLLISRANVNDVDVTTAEVSLVSIVHHCVEHARATIDHKRLCVAVDLDGVETLPAPAAALEIIARNLIDNAVHYTPDGGSLTIRTDPGGNGSPALLVENGPVDLVEKDLTRLFEPFWRSDKAHSDRAHVGLGLTVVHRIADAMGLRVEAALAGNLLQMRVAERNQNEPERRRSSAGI